jgi:hypothetical protein
MSNVKSRERTNMVLAIDANTSDADDIGCEASTLVHRISLASVQEIDRLIGVLKDLRTKIESGCSRIQNDIVEFAELSQSTVQLTKIASDSVAQVERGPVRSNSSSSSEMADLEVVARQAVAAVLDQLPA